MLFRSLDEVKEESEKVGLKLNIQKMKIMAFGPITSWEIDGETMDPMQGAWVRPLVRELDPTCRNGD